MIPTTSQIGIATGTDLIGTDLTGTDLTGTDLTGIGLGFVGKTSWGGEGSTSLPTL